MDTEFKLSEYMNKGIENIVKGIVKASLRNPKEIIFAVKYRQSSKEAQKKRAAMEQKGQKVPAFLIGSITSSCNLFCKGCYARANKLCGE